jgi:hypothetical protein
MRSRKRTLAFDVQVTRPPEGWKAAISIGAAVVAPMIALVPVVVLATVLRPAYDIFRQIRGATRLQSAGRTGFADDPSLEKDRGPI